MKLMTILYAEHGRDVPVPVPAPTPGSDDGTALRRRRMQDKLESAKLVLGERYVLHPSNVVRRGSSGLFTLEKSK
jgi:hypothetical protein